MSSENRKEGQLEIAHVLFMDIVGYSKLRINEQGSVQQQLNQIVRNTDQFRDADAADKLIRLPVGDGMALVFFNSPEAPVQCALEISKALQRHPQIRLRMGIHSGPVNQVQDVNNRTNLAGSGINLAQRVMACADAGHILLSKRIADDLAQYSQWYPHLHELGEVQVKHGIRISVVNLYTDKLGNPDLPAGFKGGTPSGPALAESSNALIGRELELSTTAQLLSSQDVRLLTLTGVGGTGKTRLALQLASDLRENFKDGVFFVPLAPISDPELVLSAIAQEMGIKEEGGVSVIDLFRAHRAGKQMLLVMDNFEHLMNAAPVVATLVSTLVQSKILVTSRERLHLSMEKEFNVMPLTLPSVGQPSLEKISRSAAVALFVERAHAVRPDFILSDENAGTVAEICANLDGLPLAIELAAARVRLLAPQDLLTRLENRLKLLTGGPKNLPSRQQTMRATIAWSYDLLNDSEKLLLQQLSVFSRGCALDAAEAVCNNSIADKTGLLDGITSLGEKSLLLHEESGEESRFRMLEVVKEFAFECLCQTERVGAVQRRHSDYFLNLAEKAENEIVGPRVAVWMKRLAREHDNLRRALEWCLQNEPQMALRISGSTWRFWMTHGHFTEGRKWLNRALECDSEESLARAKALLGAGTLAFHQGDFGTAQILLNEGLQVSRNIRARQLFGLCCNALGVVATCTDNFEEAQRWYEEGLEAARDLGDQLLLPMLLNNIGEIAEADGDYTKARSLYEQAVESLKRGNQMNLPFALSNLGAVAYEQGDCTAARAYYTQALAKSQEFGSKKGMIYCLDGFAALSVSEGRPDVSARLCGAADALRESIGIQPERHERKRRDRYIAKIEATLPGTAFLEAMTSGRTMTLEQAVSLALSGLN